MCFPDFQAEPRTDFDFRNRHDPLHHNENTPLENLQTSDGLPLVDMIKDFPTSDPLHLLEQGTMKKKLITWQRGSFSYKNKWTEDEKQQIDQSVRFLNKQLPSDVHRQLRSLKFLSYFKATEFRTILLYAGMVIYRNFLSDEVYKHFLRLCLAVRLCSSRYYMKRIKLKRLAEVLLSEYCRDYPALYGVESIVSNVHNIAHILDDVNRFGPLNSISTYPFENFLRDIKLRTQASNSPLEQITRRFIELDRCRKIDPLDLDAIELKVYVPQFKYETKSGGKNVFKFIRITPNVYFSTRREGDSWFITRQNEIVHMEFAIYDNNSFYIYGSELKQKENFFDQPYSSNLTDIYLSDGELMQNKFYETRQIKAKMMRISYEDKYVLIPLLHSLDECYEYNK